MSHEKPEIDMELFRKSAEVRGDTFHAIGQFIYGFSQLEFSIKFALAEYLGLSDEHFDAATGPYDFRMLCAVTSKVRCLKHPTQEKEIKTLFNECLELNNKRVQIAHGLWSEGLGDDWTVRHWNRQTLESKHFPCSVEELRRLADKAQELMQRVIGFNPQASEIDSPDQNSPGVPEEM